MQVIESIKQNLQPEGRAIATAATFELFVSVTGVYEYDLKCGLTELSHQRINDTPAIAARRSTCKEVAALIGDDGYYDGKRSHTGPLRAWGKWIEYLEDQLEVVPEDQKPRYSSMLQTAERELAELQSIIG